MVETADFHGHPILRPSYDKDFGLEKYARIAKKRGITMPPITNFGDEDRFSNFYEDTIPQKWSKEKFDAGFVVYDELGIRTIFLRGHEVPTKEGHLLAVGVKRNLGAGMPIEDTLSEGEAQEALIIADHPLIPAIRGGLGRENVLKYRDRLDALESNAQATNMFGLFSFGIFRQKPNNELVYSLGKECGLPIISNSDLHMSYLRGLPFLRGSCDALGISYNSFDDLGNNSANWLNEIKQMIRGNNFESCHDYVSGLSLFRWQVPILLSGLKDKIAKK